MTHRLFARPAWRATLLSLLLVAATAGRAHEDPVAHEIHELIDAFLAGASVNDVAMHERFWAEDLVYTSASGERRGKAEIIAGLTGAASADPADMPRYRAEALDIRVFDGFAVATFRLVAEMPDGTLDEYFNTGVLRREQGRWRAFTWQATRIPEPR